MATSPPAEKPDYLFKILLIGDSGVGKSSIIHRFVNNEFLQSSKSPNVGSDYQVRTIDVDGKRVKLQIWDTAGQERFRTLTTSYFRGANGIIIAYDIASQESFSNVPKWLQEIQNYTYDNLCLLLVGNKGDLFDQQVVSANSGKEFAMSAGMQFTEISAKIGTNVEQAFVNLVSEIKRKQGLDAETGLSQSSGTVSSSARLGSSTSSKKKLGCVIN